MPTSPSSTFRLAEVVSVAVRAHGDGDRREDGVGADETAEGAERQAQPFL